ncbi:MAG: hypothetical protein ACOY90_11725 [Candidatus Zhuqueibacterota bacterium]
MRKIFLIMTCIALTVATAEAQYSGVGLGVIIGDPTGLSLKSWHSRTHAVDAALAWSATEDKLQIHMDYLFHSFGLFRPRQGRMPLYFGIGGSVTFGDDAMVSARFPIGLDYLFRNLPCDLFVELAPKLNIMPDTEFEIDAALGIRIYLF